MSDYESKPNVVIGLTYDSEQPPTSFYSHVLYNVSTTGFNVSFSNDIVDENLFLDFFLNGSTLSGEYSQAGSPGGSTPSTINAVPYTSSEILSRTNDSAGTILYGTDTNSLYIYNGSEWRVYDGS